MCKRDTRNQRFSLIFNQQRSHHHSNSQNPMACSDLPPPSHHYHHPSKIGFNDNCDSLHQMQNGSRNEFASSFSTWRFFQRKSDKEDVASFIVDEVRGIEEELAKDQIVVCFSRVVENFDIAEFFPEQTTESRSGRDRDQIRGSKLARNGCFCPIITLAYSSAILISFCSKLTLTSEPMFGNPSLKIS